MNPINKLDFNIPAQIAISSSEGLDDVDLVKEYWLNTFKFLKRQVLSIHHLNSIRTRIFKMHFTDIVFIAMDGSSLISEIFCEVLGPKQGYPNFYILDSIDPGEIFNLQSKINTHSSLFIISCRSGRILETQLLFNYFFELTHQNSNQFVAITEPHSTLEQLALKRNFLHIFYRSLDIYGNTPTLSEVGLVPATLMGIDAKHLLDQALIMSSACDPHRSLEMNPTLLLGRLLANLCRQGKDKITFLTSPHFDSLGNWLTKLISGPTGKFGFGIIPIANEELEEAESYGDDRVFIYFESMGDLDWDGIAHKITRLEYSNHPFIKIQVREAYGIAQEFIRWEFLGWVIKKILQMSTSQILATEICSRETAKILSELENTGQLPVEKPSAYESGIAIFAATDELSHGTQVHDAFVRLFSKIKSGDFFAILAYFDRNFSNKIEIDEIREDIRRAFRIATSVSYGPLHDMSEPIQHSMEKAIFLQITSDWHQKLDIPHQGYEFGLLLQGLALGHFKSLTQDKRRVLRVHLYGDRQTGLRLLRSKLLSAIHQVAAPPSPFKKAA